ncbi:MAG TPA: succinate dehydrogenase assembly factor 2 [Rhodocyclaceae bacterium]|jgi:succinate dehydrogenase flavin-adding protein (antitoxin of CptAB toxin-antitoxin module)|nr:succinate dehydrogenase assembly factor 2 [Betaproteobacteria bacterium]HMV00407.1 succinate dehydrogenase assembly factor 2 [Rhodocyclaceae bacterium]HMV20989.1 succinate dehydrogenase assembly factor 2 [Rhodocyclaceae bacterium]HNM81274.1 succinate dehydrogenase assembly factor 2 [Rhodocyclaceae bacterium]HNP05666.1 succinate dehydrogenase assembly factor 2 [Rhodocyclaceae bacterium]
MERAELERLRWRCIRRALLELDIVLTRFLDKGFENLDHQQQLAFEELVLMEDHDLWYLISGQTECHDPRLAPIVSLLRKS